MLANNGAKPNQIYRTLLKIIVHKPGARSPVLRLESCHSGNPLKLHQKETSRLRWLNQFEH
ncbi:hypothetical protein [Fischerella sp. PCC 9605]|uniref:hypothetical protein n=1 Tax=Fischerella sp. PCC 9605 TaxID=1173024 RepID=UPI0004B4F270|nr:hypothetical protein [Fischerella sp. PCC 9605]